MITSRLKDEYFSRGAAPSRAEAEAQAKQLMAACEGWCESAEQVVGKFPGAALGAALVTGILIGWWVKR